MAFNPEKCLKFTAIDGSAGFRIPANYYGSTDGGETWKTNTSIVINEGESVYMKGTAAPCRGEWISSNPFFESTGSYKASGSITSLVDDGAGEAVDLLQERAMYNIFYSDTALKDISELKLPSKKVGVKAYKGLFERCDNISGDLPIVEAEELGESACQGTFSNVGYYGEGVVLKGQLQATVLAPYCCESMYSYAKISEIPDDFLPAMTLADNCYDSMFHGVPITKGITLPAKVVPHGAYRAFYHTCPNLVDGGEICGETFLDKIAYGGMFDSVKTLEKVTVHFTQWDPVGNSSNTWMWLNNIDSNGVLYAPAELELPETRGYDTLPETWRIEVIPDKKVTFPPRKLKMPNIEILVANPGKRG